MLTKLADRPGGLMGIEAHGKVTNDDCESILHLILDDAGATAWASGQKT